MTEDRHIIVLAKGLERYVFLFVRSRRIEMARQLARFAEDPELSFTEHDAGVVCMQLAAVTDDDGDEVPRGRW